MRVDPHRMRAMRLAREVGLLVQILPELAPILEASADDDASDEWQQTLRMLQLLQDPNFELAAAVLLHRLGEKVGGVCKRLRFSNHETDHIEWLVVHQHDLVEAPQLSQAKLKRLLSHPLVENLLALFRVETLATNSDLNSVVYCEEYLRNTPTEVIDPPVLVTGDDLAALGMQPGPLFKELLDAVRDAQLNGEIETRDEAIELVKRLPADR